MADEYTIKFLADIQMEHLTDTFKGESIDKESLFALKDSHVSQLVPGIGNQAKFIQQLDKARMCLETTANEGDSASTESFDSEKHDSRYEPSGWKKRRRVSYTNSEEADDTSEVQVNREEVKPKSPVIHLHGQELDLKDILQNDVVGKQILGYADLKGSLSDSFRNKLTTLVITTLMNYSSDARYKLSNTVLDEAASAIEMVFPKESKRIYFVPTSSFNRISHGKLPDKYRNLRFDLRKNGVITTKNLEPELPFQEHNEDLSSKETWLRHNHEPWDKVFEYWKITFPERQTQINDATQSLTDILNRWPILRDPRAYVLIEYDFSKLYGGDENVHVSQFPKVSEFILEKAKTLKEDEAISDMIKYSKNSGDSRNVIAMILLNTVCPTRSTVKGGNAKRRKSWRPSTIESTESFILQIESASDLEEKIDQRRKKLMEYGMRLQPLIIIIGNYKKPIKYYTLVDDVLYELQSIISALNVCFKVFYATKTQYPPECLQSWLFIQNAIYGMDVVCPSPKLASLLAEWGSFCNGN